MPWGFKKVLGYRGVRTVVRAIAARGRRSSRFDKKNGAIPTHGPLTVYSSYRHGVTTILHGATFP